MKKMRESPQPVSVPSTIKIKAGVEHRTLKCCVEITAKMLLLRPLISQGQEMNEMKPIVFTVTKLFSWNCVEFSRVVEINVPL